MILILVGAGGSGKSTLEKNLIEHKNYKKIVSCTTRPPRSGEKNNIDYIFEKREYFEKNKSKYLCVEEYNQWYYGLSKEHLLNCLKDKKSNYVVILTPNGASELKAFIKAYESNNNVKIVYLDVDYNSRLDMMLQTREDKEECIRRAKADERRFVGFENFADIILKNNNYEKDIEQLSKKLIKNLKNIK